MINPAVDGLAEHVGTAAACALLGRSRASHYRAKNPPPPRPRTPRPAPANKLSAAERAHVLAVLTSQRFADKSVAQVWADGAHRNSPELLIGIPQVAWSG